MAVDHLNLIPKDLQIETGPDVERSAVISGSLVLVLLIGLLVHQYRLRSQKEEVLRSLASQNDALKSQVVALNTATSSAVDKIHARLEATREILDHKIIWSEAFKELSLVTPADVWLVNLRTSVADDIRKYVITGEASSQVKVAEFFSALEASSNFRNTIFVYSERLEGIRPTLYRFEFEATAPHLKLEDKK